MKRWVTTVLLAFVAASIGYMVYTETRPQPEPAAETGGGGKPAVAVYYFHGNFRCATCNKLERYSREAVQEAFSNELASGYMTWQAVNVEKPENGHFVGDFKLTTRSLVVAGERGGKLEWANLERIWDLVGDPPAFKAYVQAGVRPFLEVP